MARSKLSLTLSVFVTALLGAALMLLLSAVPTAAQSTSSHLLNPPAGNDVSNWILSGSQEVTTTELTTHALGLSAFPGVDLTTANMVTDTGEVSATASTSQYPANVTFPGVKLTHRATVTATEDMTATVSFQYNHLKSVVTGGHPNCYHIIQGVVACQEFVPAGTELTFKLWTELNKDENVLGGIQDSVYVHMTDAEGNTAGHEGVYRWEIINPFSVEVSPANGIAGPGDEATITLNISNPTDELRVFTFIDKDQFDGLTSNHPDCQDEDDRVACILSLPRGSYQVVFKATIPSGQTETFAAIFASAGVEGEPQNGMIHVGSLTFRDWFKVWLPTIAR